MIMTYQVEHTPSQGGTRMNSGDNPCPVLDFRFSGFFLSLKTRVNT